MRISDWSSDVCSSDLALAAEGANIVINGFGDADAIEAERAGLESISGARAIYSDADLTKVDAIEAMMTKAGERFGGVDILINNAGMQHVAPVEEFPVDRWENGRAWCGERVCQY